MQNFHNIPDSQSLVNSRSLLLENDRTAISCNSGTAFPTDNLEVGMLCFRSNAPTAAGGLYELVDLTPTWKLLRDFFKTPIHKEEVDALYAKLSSNLADLPDKAMARSNLGLGTAAVATLGTGSGQVPTADDIPGLTPLPTGYGYGIRLLNPFYSVDFSPGTVRDDSNTVDLTLPFYNVKQLDAEFAEYTLDSVMPSGGRAAADDLTGAKWFRCWVIGGPGKNTQGFFSTSSNPTLPSGFTWKAHRGWIYWDGSIIKEFMQVGRNRFDWIAETGDWDVTNPGTDAVNRTVTAPPYTIARLTIGINNGTTNSNLYRVCETWKANAALTVTTADLSSQSDTGVAFMYSEKEVRVDAASQVLTQVATSGANNRIIGRCMGFIDPEL